MDLFFAFAKEEIFPVGERLVVAVKTMDLIVQIKLTASC